MRTPDQLDELAFSTDNSDNNKTLGVELENLTENSCLETLSIDGLSTSCSSCLLSKNINEGLKQRLEKLELKLQNSDLYLENSNLKLKLTIQKIKLEHESEIKNLKQNFQQIIEENIKKLKAENDISLKQKDEKINSLEEEIKKEIQINSKHKNEIEEIKNNFQKLIDENIKQLKDENVQKEEKINSLEEEIKKANDLTDKKIGDLFNFNNLNSVVSLLNNLVFVKIKNKWKEIGSVCCVNNCINTNNPVGNCIEGNGFGNIISDENIKYMLGKSDYDKWVYVYAENPFKKPQNSFNYSLYYFEIKCKYEKELNGSKLYMNIGLRNCCTTNYIDYSAKCGKIYNGGLFRLSTFSWNNIDIFGCGLVYPPTNISNEFPYVFFTQNGKQIGKGVLLKDNFDSYKPYVYLECCSVEANFGNNLESKPFKYDISKHLILKEFY
uniref:Uncharacterized protein n=1 Tax=Meloidogyne enterolobii TaxID=390850 RepID=A0A6V7W8M2_MELEN|nr:unnamed protein product [Meloidogyne enterolobii]